MCGIAGILGTVSPADEVAVRRMAAILNHRGPDTNGVIAAPGAVLGHTRLSIIDLSDRGLQPMRSEDGRHVLVFNGEIYNYRELRAELEGGHRFRGDSDSEVLLAAYRAWGDDCVRRLNGMFAFCVFDTGERTAFFARDRFGQKPLYFAARGDALVFASEIKAILAAGIPARPDMDTWARYLLTASYDDTEASYFAGISQLQPGERAWFDPASGLRRSRYYSVADHVSPRQVDVETAARETREIIVDACRLHMRADVPVAIMLSGGLDSSAMLAAIDIGGELHAGVECFSVDFGPDLTERPWIEAAARHHGLESRVDSFTPEAFHASIRPMMWHLEGPIGGLMNCALDAVMKASRDNGFTVLQDGSGMDEAFAGYRNHHNLHIGTLLASGAPGAEKAVAEYAGNWGVDSETARRAAESELSLSGTTIDGSVPVRPELLSADIAARTGGGQPPRAATGDAVRDALIDYLQIRKIPRNTRMYDRLSMAYGLELRLPFLDHRLIEHALSLPTEHYFLHGRTKSIVREAFADAMDDTVRLAAKRSIQAPQGPWLRQEPMRSYVADILDSESFAARGIFDVGRAKAAFERFGAGDYDNSFFVWQWINVEEFFRVFIDNDSIETRHPLCPSIAAPLPAQTAPCGPARQSAFSE